MVASKSPADAVAEALQLDQVAFPKHLKELATMLKEIETKLKPTIAKYVELHTRHCPSSPAFFCVLRTVFTCFCDKSVCKKAKSN